MVKWKPYLISKMLLLSMILSLLVLPRASAEIVEGIVAVVNDEVITRRDVEKYLLPLYMQYRAEYSGPELEKRIQQLQKNGLRQLVEEKLLLTEARRQEIEVPPEEIQYKLDQVKLKFPSEDEYLRTLGEQNLTEKQLRGRYLNQLMISRLVDLEVRYQVIVSPSEIKEYYEANKEQFNIPERVKLRHILLRAQNETEEEEAFQRAREIANLLHQGDSFERLAKEHSQGPHAAEGGFMGIVAQGDLSEELNQAVFALKPYKVSEIVKSPIGYHLFMVEEKLPESVMPLSEAQQRIKSLLRAMKTDEKYKEFLDSLKQKSYISFK